MSAAPSAVASDVIAPLGLGMTMEWALVRGSVPHAWIGDWSIPARDETRRTA